MKKSEALEELVATAHGLTFVIDDGVIQTEEEQAAIRRTVDMGMRNRPSHSHLISSGVTEFVGAVVRSHADFIPCHL